MIFHGYFNFGNVGFSTLISLILEMTIRILELKTFLEFYLCISYYT